MTEPMPGADRPRPDPRFTVAVDAAKPYLAATGVVSLLAGPAEVGVPVVRRLRGQSGIATGPHLVTLLNGLLGLAVVHVYRRDPDRWGRLRERRAPRWLAVVPVHLLLSPLLAARWERGVVLRGRSPLWGGVLSPIGLVHVVLTAGALLRAVRAARTADPAAS